MRLNELELRLKMDGTDHVALVLSIVRVKQQVGIEVEMKMTMKKMMMTMMNQIDCCLD